jgi:energy-coupling factor transporter ATP-binding protein EcfA2
MGSTLIDVRAVTHTHGRGPAAVTGQIGGGVLVALAGRPARETSLGEQQRAALARALVLVPEVAMLDEPTAHQDDGHVEQVVVALREASRRGTTVLVATHDPRLIDVADRVLHLHSGRLVPDGGPGAGRHDDCGRHRAWGRLSGQSRAGSWWVWVSPSAMPSIVWTR